MPKEYIVRLVFDHRHISVAMIRHGRTVGGICYRPYPEQRFGEIAFCAISGTEQLKGYGSILMNQLKRHVQKDRKHQLVLSCTTIDLLNINLLPVHTQGSSIFWRMRIIMRSGTSSARASRRASACPKKGNLHIYGSLHCLLFFLFCRGWSCQQNTMSFFLCLWPYVMLCMHRWMGYIKDYDGGTLMECYVHPNVDYLNVKGIVAKQRAFILQRLKERSE